MVSLSYSEFLVECDDDYKHHVFVRSPKGYEEITNGNYNKDALINDLIYDVSELVKERDKKQYPILDKIREEIINPNEMDKLENSNLWQKWFLNLIDKYKAESEEE